MKRALSEEKVYRDVANDEEKRKLRPGEPEHPVLSIPPIAPSRVDLEELGASGANWNGGA
jgi:hypothetical protein